MQQFRFLSKIAVLTLTAIVCSKDVYGKPTLDPTIVYSWSTVEYEWSNDTVKQEYLTTGQYIPENNLIAGIKVYDGNQYVIVPRWRLGVPSSLNVVVENDGKAYLRPFPNLEMQRVGDCNALQYVQALEIDPNTGYMWMVDTGRINYFPADGSQQMNNCPAKLVIYDIKKSMEVKRYVFPPEIVNPNSTFLNDLVLDYVEGQARFAYITDTLDYKLIVYDSEDDTSYFFTDANTMTPEATYGDVQVNENTLTGLPIGINGIAISPDFRYVYYTAVAGLSMYQVPTYILRQNYEDTIFGKEVRKVGNKVSQSDGMLATSKGDLYYSALTENAIYAWRIPNDSEETGMDRVEIKTQTKVATDQTIMQWVDTLGVDEEGYLWFTTGSIPKFLLGKLNYSQPNFFVGKININDFSYLHNAEKKTALVDSRYGQAELVYTWTSLDFDWTEESRNNTVFIKENNPFTGIKVYKGNVYINVPRWRLGVPSSLNVVTEKNGAPVLSPFPNWEMQTIGDCNAIQFSQSVEIDPNTGYMWILDTGRINLFSADDSPPQNLCPGKLIIYDIDRNREVRRYIFPTGVVDPRKTFLNDIVLDYVDGMARYAYISDTLDHKLVVYDYVKNISYFFKDESTLQEAGNGSVTVNNVTVRVDALGINGIAMSNDFKFVYYGPVAGFGLYQVPTSVLRINSTMAQFSNSVRRVGTRQHHSDGMVYTTKGSLYYPALSDNALYKWDVKQSAAGAGGYRAAVLGEEQVVVRNDRTMQWIDTLGMDEDGYIWYTAPAVQKFLTGGMDFTGKSGPNFYIWKVFVNDKSYLAGAKTEQISSASKLSFLGYLYLLGFIVIFTTNLCRL